MSAAGNVVAMDLLEDAAATVSASNVVAIYDAHREASTYESNAFNTKKLAADQGCADAQFNLGVCYHKGEGVEKNPTKAVRYYKLAVDQGNAVAQDALEEIAKLS